MSAFLSCLFRKSFISTSRNATLRNQLVHKATLSSLASSVVPVNHTTLRVQKRHLATVAPVEEDFFSGFDEEDDDSMVSYPPPQAFIGQPAPMFKAQGIEDGEIVDVSLADYLGKWTVLLFYPKDWTYVCPSEVIAFNDARSAFEKLNTQCIALSTDTPESHLAWTRLPRKQGGLGQMDIPIVADVKKSISSRYGVLNEELGIAFRGLFIINPEGVLEQSTVNNFPVGRSVDETIRLLQAFQFVAEHGEVCPANWKPGNKTIVANPEDSQEYFASEWSKEEQVNVGASSIVQVKTPKEFNELVQSGKPVVANFSAEWCGKCQQIEPFVQKSAEENPDITFVKVETTISELDELKDTFGITALPAFRFFKDRKETGNAVSGYKKRLLTSEIEKLL